MLLNTRSKGFSHQQLPLLRCTLSRGMQLDTCLDLRTHIKIKKTEAYTGKLKFKEKLTGEKKTWMDSSNVKTWLLYCLFGSVILPRRTSSGIFRYMNIGLGDIRFIRISQSTSPKYHYIGARKLNQAIYRRLSLLCANKRNLKCG